MKHTDIPVKKNDELSITIDAVGSEGQGVGRVNGYAIFVPGALAGETVRMHIIKVTASYAVGKLLEVSVPSPDRVQPSCPAYPACGGCSLQHLDYAAQLRLKQRFVSDALTRLGGFREIAVQPTLGMDTPWRYRNKGSFPLATAEHGVAFGFFRPRSHTLVPLADCPIQDERIVSVARRVSEWATAYRISAYDESTRRGILRHVMARVTTTGECMAVIVTTGKLPHEAELLALLQDVDSVYHNINDRDTNVIFGTNFRLLAGAAALSEEIAGRRFSVGPQSFLQVNAVQTAVLYGEAVRLLAPKSAETVVDAYCGVGTISLLLSAHAGRVIGIESVEPAVRDAERNAAENGCTNVSFHVGNVEDVLPALDVSIDALVVDPPRKGCDARVLQAILDSSAKRMVYVSCNPATLARDLRILADGGFRLETVQPVDMFPETCHVETICLLSKLNAKQHIEINLDMDELDLTDAEKKATYQEIKDYVLEHSGLKVSSLYIAQVKQKCGIIERENYNKPKSEDAKQPQCPPDKEKAIKEALTHFGMI